MNTYSTKLADIKRENHTIDAEDQVLGRLAVRIAGLLMGKNKTIFVRHLDTGDFVTVINAGKVKVTGKKSEQKAYYRHSGYPGGFKETGYEEMLATHPDRVIEFAVKGMLPQNKLRASMLKRLRVYEGGIPAPVKTAPAVKETKEEK